MVNLVVRHGSSHLQGSIPVKLPPIITSPRGLEATTNSTTTTSPTSPPPTTKSAAATPSAYRSPVGATTSTNNNTASTGGNHNHEKNHSRGLGRRASLSPVKAAIYRKREPTGHTSARKSPEGKKKNPAHLINEDVRHPPPSSNQDVEERQQPSVTSSSSSPGSSESLSPPSATAPAPDELVCDYDRSVTALYEMLESSRFDDAVSRCNTHPQECHTWIIRRDDDGHVRWKLLPIHAAVIFQSPLSLIETIVDVNPIGVARRDDQGMLPLHLAFRHKLEENVLEKLIKQYPGGVLCRDNRDRLPIDHCKETKFSARMMKLYSEMYGKCVQTTDDHDDDDDNHDTNLVGQNHDLGGSTSKVVASYETRIQEMKEAHEATISTLNKDYETAHQQLQNATEIKVQEIEKKHNVEMDELRGMLAREVATGQRNDQLRKDVERLQESLTECQQESKVLRRVIHDQKTKYEKLLGEMKQLSKEQKVLNSVVQQREEHLTRTERERQELLTTLLQIDDGHSTRALNDVSRMSQRILNRVEGTLNEHEGHTPTTSDIELLEKQAAILAICKPKKGSTAVITTPRSSKQTPLSPTIDDERRLRAEMYESVADAAHDDDISAITDNTNF